MKHLTNSVAFNGTEYVMQEKSILAISENTETPFYLYDVNYMIQKYEYLKQCFPYEKLKVFYAVKSNFNPFILNKMREHGFYLDTVSPAEVILARKLGYAADQIMFTANNMTDQEMETVKEQGVIFNIDSLYRLEQFGRKYPGEKVCLRINPNVIAGETVNVQTCGDLSKFGFLLEDVDKAVAIAKQYGLRIVGLHEHTGSGISETEKFFESQKNMLSLITLEKFPDIVFVDFGGGFKVPYEPDEKPIDYKAFGEKYVALFSEFCEKLGRELELCFEPGKFITADSACMIVRANTIKNNKGRLIVGTNSGFPHLIRPVFYGAYHHVVNLSNPEGETKVYDIYGNTCESGDCFAKQREISEIRVGDYLAIQNAGAYCRSMASEYNLRPLPGEYCLYDGGLIQTKKKLAHEELADRILSEYTIK